MILKRKKVCLLVCSSIFGLHKDKLNDWVKQMPELGIIADIEPVFVFSGNSIDIKPEVWIKLAQEISRRMSQYDGFVVIHGVDNLLYTASALSFLLQNLIKPVVFTGSKYIGIETEKKDSKNIEIKANLINAVQVINYEFTEVGLMFGNRLLRASQASTTSDGSLNIFTVPDAGVLGRIDFSFRIFDQVVIKNTGKAKLFNKLEANIEILNLVPVINSKMLAKKNIDKQGIIINAGGYQSLPEDLILFFGRAARNTPVIIWSDKFLSPILGLKNISVINNLTWETTITKFMWILTQTHNVKKVKGLMARDIVGEIIYSK